MDTLSEKIEVILGDVPVSEQLGAALEHMSPKDHSHDNYVTREEFNDLKRKLDTLIDLVGDCSVSEQIYMALNNIK